MSTQAVELAERVNEDEADRTGAALHVIGERLPTKWRHIRRIPFYALTLTMIAPYYWMITSSFKGVEELNQQPPTFWPNEWIGKNYYDTSFSETDPQPGQVRGLFQQYPDLQLGFMHFVLNSLFIVITITLLTLFIASLAAYVVSKHRFKGKRIIYLVIIGSMMIPWQVGLIPNYLTVDAFGWINTYWAYIIPALPKAFIVFFLTQYLASIPDELVEAARIDGAGELTIYFRIIVPLLKPALIAMIILTAIGEWNNFLWPLIIANEADMYNLPVALSMLKNAAAGAVGSQGMIMGAALFASIPTVLLYFFAQKHFVRGIVLSGIK